MSFKDTLREIRENREMTQQELATASGISCRMIQRYECGSSRPRIDAVQRLAAALETTPEKLMGPNDLMLAQAAEQYGSRGVRQAKDLMEEVTGLFTGGTLAPEDMDTMMQAIQEAYWIAKKNNRKYTPKKSRKA